MKHGDDDALHSATSTDQAPILNISAGKLQHSAQLDMIRQAFNGLILTKMGGYCMELRVVFRQNGQDSSDNTIAKWIKK